MVRKKIIIGTRSLSGDLGALKEKNVTQVIEYLLKKKFFHYDTAPVYGKGKIDKILSNYKKKIIVNTKCGYDSFHKKKTFKLSDMQSTIDKSLKLFDKINILYLHNPRLEIKNWNKIINFLKKLKEDGIINYIGISLARDYYFNSSILNEFDYIQDEFNLLRFPKKNIISDYKEKFVARSPLASGILSKNFNKNIKFSKKDYRFDWLKKDRKLNIKFQVNQLNKITSKNIEKFAFSFLLNNKSVKYINYGIKNKAHVDFLLNRNNFFKIEKNLINKIKLLNDYNYNLPINKKGY